MAAFFDFSLLSLFSPYLYDLDAIGVMHMSRGCWDQTMYT